MPSAKRNPLKTTRTEAEVSRQVVEAAQMLGIELKRRNVGAFANPKGRMVRCADVGDGDFYAVLPDGRHMDLEIKAEGFDPNKLTGEKKAHFDRQFVRLKETNRLGGVGFFCDDAEVFLRVMQIVLRGGRVKENGYENLIVYDPNIIEYPENSES
jgi:hypothetical protein